LFPESTFINHMAAFSSFLIISSICSTSNNLYGLIRQSYIQDGECFRPQSLPVKAKNRNVIDSYIKQTSDLSNKIQATGIAYARCFHLISEVGNTVK